MELKVRVKGVNKHIRNLAALSDTNKQAAIDGVLEAAKHLLERVKGKIGRYQPSGGKPQDARGYGRGAWPQLKFETIQRKLRRWGVGNKPLYASGDLLESFDIVKGGKGRIAASVGSSSPYLVHHVYGAPRAGIPQRDPIRITAVEEMEACTKIIEDAIYKNVSIQDR